LDPRASRSPASASAPVFTKGGQPEGPARTTLQSLRRDSLRRELWTLRNPAVDGAIAGFRRRDQVDPIVAAANLELGEDDIAMIEGRA
jgi:hypothetical protein